MDAADEATRIRIWGSPDVVRAFDAAGDAYRGWSDADDGTLTETRKGELRETCWAALATLTEAVRQDLAQTDQRRSPELDP